MSSLNVKFIQQKFEKKLTKLKKNKNKIIKQIDIINNIIHSYDNDNNELPMSSNFNLITNKNIEFEKSKNYTNKLINKLKQKSIEIVIKKEVEEEIVIPNLEI